MGKVSTRRNVIERRGGRLCRWAALVLSLSVLAAASVIAEESWVKLSRGESFSDVRDFKISPAGDRVVYRHDADTDEAVELWSVPTTGGPPVRLSELLPSGSFVHVPYYFTPDGSRVVYRAPQDTLGLYELYSVPAGGGASTKLNDQPGNGDGQVGRMSVSPDGSRVVYTLREFFDNVLAVDLYSVPITGGDVDRLNPTPVPGGRVRGETFLVSPDGSRVVYRQDRDLKDRVELFSVPIGGGPVEKLNDELADGGEVYVVFLLSPDGSRVVYHADQHADDVRELYSVAITGGPVVKLNGLLVSGGDVRSFRLSPDGNRVVYVADQQTDEAFELYSVPIGGVSVVKLNDSLAAGSSVSADYRVSADSRRVVYRADQDDPGFNELYSVPIASGLVVKLNGSLPAGADVFDFKLNADNDWVVYRADQTVNDFPHGFRVPLAGPTGSDEIIWQAPSVLNAHDYAIEPGGDHVVVLGNRIFHDTIERLWRVPLTGTPRPRAVELIPAAAFDPSGDVSEFAIGADGTIVYLADQDTHDVTELYAIPALIFSGDFES